MRHRSPLTLLLLFALFPPLYGQTYTWTGGGGNGNWSTATNWTGGTPTSSAGTIIELNTTTQTTTNQNVTNPFVLNQLNMLVDSTDGFVVNGGQLQFSASGAQISNAAAAALQVNSAVDFAVDTTIDLLANNTSGREAQFTGPLTAGAGTTVTVTNSTQTTPGTITVFQGTNYGFLGTLSVTNNSIVHTTGANTLARTATVSTTGALSVFTVGTLAASGLTATGASVQLGSVTGSGQFSLGDSSITSAALVGVSGNTLDTVSGTLAVGNVSSHIGKVGTGEWRFTGTSNSTVNGGFSVRDGLVNFTGSSSSTGGFGTTSTGIVQVYAGAEVRIALTGTGSNGRLGNSQPLILSGGTLRLDASAMGSSGSGYSDVVGALTVGTGQSTVRIDTSTGRGVRFNFSSLTTPASSTGTVAFLSNNLGGAGLSTAGAGNVNFVSAPTSQLVGATTTYGVNTTDLAVLPYGFGGSVTGGLPTTFVTFDGTNNSIRGLADTNYATALGTATDNVSLNSTGTVTSATTANALRLTAGGSVSNSSTLTLTAGALLNNGGGDITGAGTLEFGTGGSRTAYVTTNGAMAIGNAISAANVSKNGAGNVTLTGTTTLTGSSGSVVAVNAGTLTLGAGSGVTTTNALSASNTLTYQVSRGATLDVTATGLSVGEFTTLTGGAATSATGTANQGRVVGNVTVASGGTIAPSALGGSQASLASPGTLSVDGNLTLDGGSSYVWYVNSAVTNGDNTVTPTAGTLADFRSPYTSSLITTAGTLDLTGASAGNRITLKLTSLSLANGSGGVYDLFDNGPNAVQRSWVILDAGAIDGYSADKFTLDASALGVSADRLQLSRVENSLVLTFTPVPEPAAMLAVCGLAAGVLAGLRRRLRRVPTAG